MSKFLVLPPKGKSEGWSVFDDTKCWLWSGFASLKRAEEFRDQLDAADNVEYKRLRKYTPQRDYN